MSTRCNIEIYDRLDEENPRAILYHHADGYPDFMQGKLERFMEAAYEYLKEAGYPYWWDAERVAAVLIALSIEDYEEPLKPFSTDRGNQFESKNANAKYRIDGGVPVFQPCLQLHGDIAYIWKVRLLPEGKFEITHARTY